LPNSFNRYLSPLRNFITLSITKYGLTRKHIENLRKIHYAESFFYKNNLQSVDINKLCTNLLGAIKTIKPDFDFKCDTFGNFFINKNLFTLLLLTMSKEINYIDVAASNSFLQIRASYKSKKALRFVRALNGYSLFEIKTEQNLILIPTKKTNEESVPIESEWEYIFNKFSVLNMYFIK
jgi:hypothetical protein